MAGKLQVIAGNKAERRVLLEILAVCGVLSDPDHPGFRTGFVPLADRSSTGAHFEDSCYPLPWWRGSHGVDRGAVEEWLPGLLR